MYPFAAAADSRAQSFSSDALAVRAHAASAPAVRLSGPWEFTRLIADRGRFVLCRARCRGELGPGCYIVKRPRLGSPAAAIRRAELRREAALAAAMNDPHLVSVLADDLSSDLPQLVLPYLEGASLARLLAAAACHRGGHFRGPLPFHFALSLTRQIASALAALHRGGWLHGQASPRHILISPQGHTTLIDLTQARQLAGLEAQIETTAAPAHPYSAPELFRRGVLTAAADIYSLGATFFETLSGQTPFASLAGADLAVAHRTWRPPDLRQFRLDATLEIAELADRMLAKEPLRRPTAEQLVKWLAELEIAELSRTMP